MALVKFLDPDTEGAVRDFLARIPADIRLERAILFGSRARGEHGPESDADLALILHERGNDGQTAEDAQWVLATAKIMTVTSKMIKVVPWTLISMSKFEFYSDEDRRKN
jgi:predicted nucleotidyltransferase